MCGIAGIVKYNLDKVLYASCVENMVQSIIHRGPDAQTKFATEDSFLGHVRLSIVDIEGGGQPMQEPNSKNVIVFNGEIYGYQQIKNKYIDYRFQTNSDTELLLSMYAKNGVKMLDDLPGMFAFSIWDEENKKLFAARDRFGEKPYYYAIGNNGEFIFASEIKAIIASGLIEPELDLDSVKHYLKRLYVHPSKTIYKNIQTLPPAHALIFEKEEVTVWRYWNLPVEKLNIGFEDAKVEFKSLLERAVEKQLVADVPVAAFLSGGLDSSTIVALAAQRTEKLMTFSFGFKGDKSELKYAKQISEKYNTNHIELEESSDDIADLLLKMHSIYDEPFADSSNIPTYLISKKASEYAKVVLTGDGCDELMAGYNFWYRQIYELEKANSRSNLDLLYAKLMRSFTYRLNSPNHMMYHEQIIGIESSKKGKTIDEIFKTQRDYFKENEMNQLFSQEFLGNENGKILLSLDDILKEDLQNYMNGDILVKTDRASMANSIELRAPFLDKDFASFCIELPLNFKITRKQEKYLFREAYGDLWTEDIRKRGKQGFAALVHLWLKIPSVKKLKMAYLKDRSNKMFKILNYDAVDKYFEEDTIQTWTLLNLSIWMEKNEFSIN
jgi:asparagine synthase (glutamine-hydrolysing)